MIKLIRRTATLLSVVLTVMSQADGAFAKAKCVALTFDDGPASKLTPRLLRVLAKHRVRATFFVVGWRIKKNKNLLLRMYRAGHEIGNHSWSHPNFTHKSDASIAWQVRRTDVAVSSIIGRTPSLFRPPFGAWNKRVQRNIGRKRLIMWDVDTQDWRRKNRQRVINIAVNRARAGSIILMHDTHGNTVSGVSEIIIRLRARGFRFTTVSGLRSC